MALLDSLEGREMGWLYFLPQKPPVGPRAASFAIPLPFPCRMPKIPLPRRLAFGS